MYCSKYIGIAVYIIIHYSIQLNYDKTQFPILFGQFIITTSILENLRSTAYGCR